MGNKFIDDTVLSLQELRKEYVEKIKANYGKDKNIKQIGKHTV